MRYQPVSGPGIDRNFNRVEPVDLSLTQPKPWIPGVVSAGDVAHPQRISNRPVDDLDTLRVDGTADYSIACRYCDQLILTVHCAKQCNIAGIDDHRPTYGRGSKRDIAGNGSCRH